jgi:hypothetical protein
MTTTYEYKFVRIGEYAGSALFGVRDKERNAYESIVHDHAREGWRLVQIFAPGVAAFGAARYYELIFEREASVPAMPSTLSRDDPRDGPCGADDDAAHPIQTTRVPPTPPLQWTAAKGAT